MLSKSKLYRIFIEILLCQVALIVILGLRKSSYFVDEIWTYNLANANYFPAFANVDGYFYSWVQPDFWRRLIVVDSMNTFDYGSVWYNQSQDVLPPFFYAIVHTVASFYPLEFSKWFVMGPNICFFIGTQLLLLMSAIKLYGYCWQALLPSMVYGFTLSGINTTLYFRMYMMLTFFGMISFYLHLLIWDRIKKQEKVGALFLLVAICDVCGFLTHYYFLIFAFFLFIFFFMYMNRLGMYKQALQYIGASISALGLSVAIFPPCIKQILGIGEYGYRGAQSLSNVFSSNFLERLSEYNSMLGKDLGGDILLLLLFIVVCMMLNTSRKEFMQVEVNDSKDLKNISFRFFKPKNEYSFAFNNSDSYAFIAFLISVAYYLLIVKISVMNSDRYIFMVLPLFVLWGSYVINRIVTKISGKRYFAMIMCVVAVLVSAAASFRVENLHVADDEIGNTIAYVEENHKETPMVIVNQIPHWHPIIEHIFLIEKAQQAYLVTENDIGKIKKGLTEIDFDGEELLAFVTWECKKSQKDILEELKQVTGFSNIKPIYNGGKYKRGHLYLLSK